MKIHRTAIVSPKAEIADDVEIGPYVVIEGEVTIGPGCIIKTHAILSGSVRMGKGNVIGYGAIIGANPQDHSFKPETKSHVEIGDYNCIREYCTIHRGTAEGSATIVGDHNYIMAGTHLAHNVKVGSHGTFGNNVLFAGHVEIQDHAYIGGGSVFHQHLRVGAMCFVQGVGKVGKDVPPYCIAAGKNTVVGLNTAALRHAGYSEEQRREVHRAFNLLYRAGLNTTQALEEAEHMAWGPAGRLFFDFVNAAKKRGICDIRKTRQAAAGKILAQIREHAVVA